MAHRTKKFTAAHCKAISEGLIRVHKSHKKGHKAKHKGRTGTTGFKSLKKTGTFWNKLARNSEAANIRSARSASKEKGRRGGKRRRPSGRHKR